jgi:hypothetical protein
MPLVTLKQLRDNIATTVRETQQSDLIDSYLNLVGLEIFNYHSWTWKRRKTTFATVADQEDYNLDSEVGEIAFMRQITSPQKLVYVPDHIFYKIIPNPESLSTSDPRFYRRWEETGFATNLAAADTVYVNSSSSSDGSSFNVRIRGRNSSGEIIEETLTLNGTTNVTSSTTWAASGLLQISKSGTTTGTITCYRTTGAILLSEMEPNNLAPRFLRISFYPVPSSAITIYLEYFERYRYLVHNTDIFQMDNRWNWIAREGTLAKMWEYKQNEGASALHQAIYDRALKQMVAEDSRNADYIPVLQRRQIVHSTIKRYSDSVSDNFPVYGVGF